MAEALLSICAWLALAWGALTLPTTAPGEAANVAIAGDFAYATLGAGGIEIVRLAGGERRAMALPPGASADDLAVADGLLFVLDARPPGGLSVYSLADPAAPALREPPVAVEVGPFAGVSAAAGRVAVSGGTGLLSLRGYARDGRLGAEVATADLGRGQPDLRLSPDGQSAFVSTHVFGPRFELRVVRLGSDPLRIEPGGSLPLATFGFTPGGARPASFPVQSGALPGGLVLVAHAAGLGVVDAADPGAPRLLRVLDVGVLPVAVDAQGGVAAVVGSSPEPRLVVLDLRDPARAEIAAARALPAGSLATGVAIGPSQVAVAAHARGVLVFAREGLAETR
jgi:hypothetical protein